MPYTYDSFAYWEGCTGHSLLDADDDGDDDWDDAGSSGTAPPTTTPVGGASMWSSLSGIWGAMRK
jgi:hypothetical protein